MAAALLVVSGVPKDKCDIYKDRSEKDKDNADIYSKIHSIMKTDACYYLLLSRIK